MPIDDGAEFVSLGDQKADAVDERQTALSITKTSIDAESFRLRRRDFRLHDGIAIAHVSTNAAIAICWQADALRGAPLAILLGEDQLETLQEYVLSLPSPELLKPWPCRLQRQDEDEATVYCLAHWTDGSIFLELFPKELMPLRQRMIDELRKPETLDGCCAAAVRMVRLLSESIA